MRNALSCRASVFSAIVFNATQPEQRATAALSALHCNKFCWIFGINTLFLQLFAMRHR